MAFVYWVQIYNFFKIQKEMERYFYKKETNYIK